MGSISFNTTSRVIDVLNQHNTGVGIDLYKVHDAACDYNYLSKLLVRLFGITAGIKYFKDEDHTKKLFATSLMLKLQRKRTDSIEIAVDLPNYVVSIKQINQHELECRINGKFEGILKCNLDDLKMRCIRKH